jgi:dipeptidyl aminopeptidase/acylaminoacyl peptidase
VTFENEGVSLQGELVLPSNSPQYPLAIFIHGSGRATRNNYQEFVTPLVDAGIAVFRYDKRGVGDSGGHYDDVGPYNSERVFTTLASDAAAAIRHLKNHKMIASDKVIVIGGSQAGWIIPEINAITDVWLSVCLSGPAVSVGEEIFYSDLAEHGATTQQEADERLAGFKGMHGYSPLTRIGTMRSPSLWVFGGRDVSIPVKRSLALLDSIGQAQHIPLEIKLYPDADHGLFNHAKGEREDYVKEVIQWITNINR